LLGFTLWGTPVTSTSVDFKNLVSQSAPKINCRVGNLSANLEGANLGSHASTQECIKYDLDHSGKLVDAETKLQLSQSELVTDAIAFIPTTGDSGSDVKRFFHLEGQITKGTP
jgi:hypothetical protein